MTILFLTRLFYPHIGGVEKHVLELSKQLIKDGHKVIVVTENHDWKEKEVVEKIEVYRMDVGEDNWTKKFRIWSWLLGHKSLIQQADIVHCHDVFFWYFPFKFLYLKKPIFTTFHGYEAGKPVSTKAVMIRKLSEYLSKGNICIGKYIATWYGTNPTYVLYGAAEPIMDLPKINPTKTLQILFLGRLEKDMDVPLYLTTLQVLKDKNISYSLSVYGDGSMRKEVEKFGKVYGFVQNITAGLVHTNFVFASSYLSILEAFAAKKLVFAAYNTLLKRDYLEETPFKDFVIISHTAEDLAEKIIYYKDHPNEAQEKINKATDWVSKQTWESVKETYYSLWNVA